MRKKDPVLMQTIVDYINDYYRENGRTPSTRNIATGCHTNKQSVMNYLHELDEKGKLTYAGRHIETAEMKRINRDNEEVRVVGSVSCGIPFGDEEQVDEIISLPASIFGRGKLYLLEANGNSMIEAGIDDGDYIVVQQTSEARDGDIVVALVDGAETTLKRFFIDTDLGMIRLHPENRHMEDILVDECVIQGVATHVIKNIMNPYPARL